MRARKWLAVGGAIAVVMAAALIVKFIVAPSVIRARITAAAEQNWDGTIAIEQVRFRYFGPDRLDGVMLTDRRNRQWLQADRVYLSPGRWHVFDPRPGKINAQQVKISLYVDEDGLSVPLKDTGGLAARILGGNHEQPRSSSASLAQQPHGPRPAETSGHASHTAAPPGGIRELVVNHLEATAWHGGRSVRLLENAGFALEHRRNHYGLLIFEKTAALWRRLSIGGRIRTADGHSAFHVHARRSITPDEGAFLIGLLNGPGDWSAGGLLEIDGAVSGPIARPAELAMNGTARLDGWSLQSGHHAAIKNLDMRINIHGHRYDMHGFACTVYDACVKGDLWAVIDPADMQAAAFGGTLTAKGISMKDVAREIGAAHRTARGTASAKVNFTMHGGIEDLRGNAVLLFEDTSLSMFPLTLKIMEGMGLPVDPSQASDMACAFDFSGPAGIIHQSRFANHSVAMETRPGGMMNAATGQVDLCVVARPLAPADDPASQASTDDGLLCLHVKGNYWDAAGQLITRQPIDHLSDETIGFLKRPIAPLSKTTDGAFDSSHGLPEARPAR